MDLSPFIASLDVLPSDNRDLRDPATQQIRALNQDVVEIGIAIEVSRSGDGCEQQADLLLIQGERCLLGMQQKATRHWMPGNTCDR